MWLRVRRQGILSSVDGHEDSFVVPIVTADNRATDLPVRFGSRLRELSLPKWDVRLWGMRDSGPQPRRLNPLHIGCSTSRSCSFLLACEEFIQLASNDQIQPAQFRGRIEKYLISTDRSERALHCGCSPNTELTIRSLCHFLIELLELTHAIGCPNIHELTSAVFGQVISVDLKLTISLEIFLTQNNKSHLAKSIQAIRSAFGFIPRSEEDEMLLGSPTDEVSDAGAIGGNTLCIHEVQSDTQIPRIWRVAGSHCPKCKVNFLFTVGVSHCRVCGWAFCKACVGYTVHREFARVRKPGCVENHEFVKSCEGCYREALKTSKYRFLTSTFMLSGLSCAEIAAVKCVSAAWCDPALRVLSRIFRMRTLSGVASYIPWPRLRKALLSSRKCFRGHPQAVLVLHKALASESPTDYFCRFPHPSENVDRDTRGAWGETHEEATHIVLDTLTEWCDGWALRKGSDCYTSIPHKMLSHEEICCPPSCSVLLPQFAGLELLSSMAVADDVPDFLASGMSDAGMSWKEQLQQKVLAQTTGALLKRLAVKLIFGGTLQLDPSEGDGVFDVETLANQQPTIDYVQENLAIYKALIPALVDGLAATSVRWTLFSCLSALAAINKSLALCIALELGSRSSISEDHAQTIEDAKQNCYASAGTVECTVSGGCPIKRTSQFLKLLDALDVRNAEGIIPGLLAALVRADLVDTHYSVRGDPWVSKLFTGGYEEAVSLSNPKDIILDVVSQFMPDGEKPQRITKVVVKHLPDLKLRPLLHPFDAEVVIVGLRLSGIQLKENAATKPMVLPFVDDRGHVHSIIYKREPMRQDMVAARVNALLLFLLEKNASVGSPATSNTSDPIVIPRYDVVCTTPSSGIIQLVPKATTLQDIFHASAAKLKQKIDLAPPPPLVSDHDDLPFQHPLTSDNINATDAQDAQCGLALGSSAVRANRRPTSQGTRAAQTSRTPVENNTQDYVGWEHVGSSHAPLPSSEIFENLKEVRDSNTFQFQTDHGLHPATPRSEPVKAAQHAQKRRGPLLSYYLTQICGHIGERAAFEKTVKGRETPMSHTADRGGQPISELEAGRRFLHSAQYFLVVNYWLAISDRHRDNVMVTEDGYVFHIDFGFMLGSMPVYESYAATVFNPTASNTQFIRFDADFRECVVYFMKLVRGALLRSVDGERAGEKDRRDGAEEGEPRGAEGIAKGPVISELSNNEAVELFIKETAELFLKLRPHAYAVLMLLRHLIRHTHSIEGSTAEQKANEIAGEPEDTTVNFGGIGQDRSAVASVSSTVLYLSSNAAKAASAAALKGASAAGSALCDAAVYSVKSLWGKWTPNNDTDMPIGLHSGIHNGYTEQRTQRQAHMSDASFHTSHCFTEDFGAYLESRTELFSDHSMDSLSDSEARALFEERMRSCLVSTTGTMRDWAHDAAAVYKKSLRNIL